MNIIIKIVCAHYIRLAQHVVVDRLVVVAIVVVVARCWAALRALRRRLFPPPPIDLMADGWDVDDDQNWGPQWPDPAGQ